MNPFNPPLTNAELQVAFHGCQFISVISNNSGQGEVHEVVNNSGQHCALKLFAPSQDPARVTAEILALQKITHPCFLRVYGYGPVTLRGSQCMYTMLEYIDGLELAELLNQGRKLTDDEAKDFVGQISDGLELLWNDYRIVHRDIKPGNILLEHSSGRYVLIDLAYARHLLLPSMTLGGNPGTAGYMSPEQAQGRRALTVKSDVFALGLVTYELRTGVHPYQHRQYVIGAYRPAPLASVVNGLDPTLSRTVEKMMDDNPLLRPTPAEIKDSL